MSNASNMAEYFFHQGTNYKAYEYLGAHSQPDGGFVFRVWAPNADRIFVVGDFADWALGVPMERCSEGGVWECTVPEAKLGDRYKYKTVLVNNTAVMCLFFELGPSYRV